MFIGFSDLFKIGIGPSSSHTVGPMVAARRFLADLAAGPHADAVARVRARLFGSLALTGKGHGTDTAIVLGFAGFEPATVDPDSVPTIVKHVGLAGLVPCGRRAVAFEPATDIEFVYGEFLPQHANGMRFQALATDGEVLVEQEVYSIGGGFIATREEMERGPAADPGPEIPYPFGNAADMLAMGRESGLRIADMMLANEFARRPRDAVMADLHAVEAAMESCIARGGRSEGILPGGLNVVRRAPGLMGALPSPGSGDPMLAIDAVSAFAIAVNEENAAGGRIVTAPTNGAAGVFPALLAYYKRYVRGANPAGVVAMFMAATAIGSLIKRNASISGAEVGCQGEVGAAAAMAAAGLTAALDGTNAQVENAAEIAIEHHLGMTCDPVAGLVQVPCIERNAVGAVKALAAASMALKGEGTHRVTLDVAIETMRQTGRDMNSLYKETSQGGLAVNVVAC